MNLNDLRWAFLLLALPLLMSSCGGGKDDPTPPPPEPVATEGAVSLTLDVSTYQPGALMYYFYSTGGQAFGDPRSCDGQGNYTNDKFAIGTYRVLAVNTSASGVEFRGMDSHASASVHLSAQATNRSADLSLVSQPGVVYSVVVGEVTVSADVPASHSPAPVLLTKSINLPLALKDGLGADVVSIAGTLQGVYPSVNLSTGTPVSSVSDCENIAVAFAATGEGNARSAAICLFGICDPQGGDAYTNTLQLALTFSNGDTQELSVDLTDALTDAISGNDGDLPLDLELPVDIERTAIGLNATVGDWSAGGESEKELQ